MHTFVFYLGVGLEGPNHSPGLEDPGLGIVLDLWILALTTLLHGLKDPPGHNVVFLVLALASSVQAWAWPQP